MNNHVAAIAFTPAPTQDSPNLVRTGNRQVRNVFHRLIELCFSSVRRWNPTTALVLVTTAEPGGAFAGRLRSLGAQVFVTPFSHRPPEGSFPAFNASLFSVDAIDALSAAFDPDTSILLLDPDVVATRDLTPVFARVPDSGFLAYDLAYAPDHVNQGISARRAGELHERVDPGLRGIPRHYGGELYGFRPDSWRAIRDRVESAWQLSLRQLARDDDGLVTEEHLLNYALRYTTVEPADGLIRRIWTAPTHRTGRPGDLRLPLWHLPAEKHRGLARLYPACTEADSWFWTADSEAWLSQAARACGVGRRAPGRWLRDTGGRQARTLQRSLSRSSRG